MNLTGKCIRCKATIPFSSSVRHCGKCVKPKPKKTPQPNSNNYQCVICGKSYHKWHNRLKTCTKECGAELRKRTKAEHGKKYQQTYYQKHRPEILRRAKLRNKK